MLVNRHVSFLSLILVIECVATSVSAIEVKELAGAAHGYPGLCDSSGKKIADGEFRQWVEDHHLNVVITYRFPNGRSWEEKSRFRQGSELIQEQWSWKELIHGKPQREFNVDFVSGIAAAHLRQDKDVSEKIQVEPGRTFAGFGFSIALSTCARNC